MGSIQDDILDEAYILCSLATSGGLSKKSLLGAKPASMISIRRDQKAYYYWMDHLEPSGLEALET